MVVHGTERGRLKQALIKVGWPAEDEAAYVAGAPYPIALAEGTGFQLRDYQQQAVEGFFSAGSGVVVLPCGAGKTAVGMAAMAVRAPITPYMMALQEKCIRGTMYGSVRPDLDFPRLVDLYMQGRLKIDELVSRTYRLEEINEGFAALRTGQVARGVITFD